LVEVQNSVEMFVKKETEMSTLRNNKSINEKKLKPLIIIIPSGTTKDKVHQLKQYLLKRKTDLPTGRIVKVNISGQEVEIPFKILDNEEKLEKVVLKILNA